MAIQWNLTMWLIVIFITPSGCNNEIGDRPLTKYNAVWAFDEFEENEDSSRIKRSSSVGIVDIARFKFSLGTPYSVYVDGTMTRLILNVAVERSKPVIDVLRPSGVAYPAKPTVNGTASQGTVVTTFDIPITSADYGIWKFSRNDANTWDVTIQAESPIYITHQLLELGSNTPVVDYPIIGKSYKLEVTVEGYSQVQSVDIGFLYSKDKTAPVGMIQFVPKGSKIFEAKTMKTGKKTITMPPEVVMVGIQGKDKTGHPYKRLDTNEIIPVSLKLEVPLQTGKFVEENTSLNITFTVTNILATSQVIDIRIEDDQGLVQMPKVITSNSLKAGENFTGTFKLTAGSGGLTTLVKIQARHKLGSGTFSSGPTEWRNITIFQKTTTTTSTTSTTTTPTTTMSSSAASATKKALSTTKPGSHVTTNVKLADIARFNEYVEKDYIVHVDATIQRLVLQVSADKGNPVIVATEPSGIPYAGHPTLDTSSVSGTVKATMDIPIASGDHGIWKFTKLDGNTSTWDVKVQAESPVSVTQQLFEVGSTVPLFENPVPGKAYDIELTVEGVSNIKTVNTAFIVLKKANKGAGFAILTHKTGNKYITSSVKIPNEIFMIGVQGMDNGKPTSTFRRIDPTEITPMSLKLDVPAYSGATIFEYSTFNVTFTVTNLLSTSQDIDVRISDERKFALAPTTLSDDALKPGGQFSGTFVLNVSFAGLSTAVKIVALPRIAPKEFGPGPEEIRNFTVIKNETTTTASTTPSTTLPTSSEPSNNTSQDGTDDSSKITESTAVAVIVGCAVAGIVIGAGVVATVMIVHAKKAKGNGSVTKTRVEPIRTMTREEPIRTLPKEDPIKSMPKDDPIKSTPKDEPVRTMPKEDPIKPTPKEEPIKPTPKEDTIQQTPREEPIKPTAQDVPAKTTSKDVSGKTTARDESVRRSSEAKVTDYRRPSNVPSNMKFTPWR